MRLIDADALRKQAETCRETTDGFIELIDNAPAVVPENMVEISELWKELKMANYCYECERNSRDCEREYCYSVRDFCYWLGYAIDNILERRGVKHEL